MENLADRYKHINGWGIDADPRNEPTYPMKKYTGEDHKRLNYQRPTLQEQTVEILKSNERPNLPAAFGTSAPPLGLSGAVRRFAFQHSENSLAHWLPLVLADRINVVEGILIDLSRGIIPNIFAEKGMGAAWKYDRKKVIQKTVVAVVVVSVIFALFSQHKPAKKRKKALI